MKTLAILLVTAFGFAQSADPNYNEFKKTLEAYLSSPDSKVKPSPCGDYMLRYVVKAENFKETVYPMNSNSLCADLEKFDSSKNPVGNPGWSYDIKAVGNKYYIIRADQNTDSVRQEFYYYERKK